MLGKFTCSDSLLHVVDGYDFGFFNLADSIDALALINNFPCRLLILNRNFHRQLIHLLLELLLLAVKLARSVVGVMVRAWKTHEDLRKVLVKYFLQVYKLTNWLLVFLLLCLLEESPPFNLMVDHALENEFINGFGNHLLDRIELIKRNDAVGTTGYFSDLLDFNFIAFFEFFVEYAVHFILHFILGWLLRICHRLFNLCVCFAQLLDIGVVFQIVMLDLAFNIDSFEPVFDVNLILKLSLHCYHDSLHLGRIFGLSCLLLDLDFALSLHLQLLAINLLN